MDNLKQHFMLDPDVIYLNHGSFGATPRPVFEIYQEWQQRLERQPVYFFQNILMGDLEKARLKLAEFIHTKAEDVVFVPNATYGVNLVARSLKLDTGDEILASNHEYGACDNAWEFICQKSGATYLHQPIQVPAGPPDQIIEGFWQGVSTRTRLIFLSHITSPTALQLPVEAICQRARQAGILTFIDGAHAPGQIPVNLDELNPDFYVGNCHKWMFAPKGTAFLYTHAEVQHMVEPLVISWGWGKNSPFKSGSVYLDSLQWAGTNDYSAYLTIPAAIQFQTDHHWEVVRHDCHNLLQETLIRISDLTSLPSAYRQDAENYHQMAIAPLPDNLDLQSIKQRLYDKFRVEIPFITWNDRNFIRISIQGYNSGADVDILIDGLQALLPQLVQPT